VGCGFRLPFRHNRTSLVPEEPSHGIQTSETTLKGKAGHLVTVMDNWEQFHTNATLLKPAKHCPSLFRALQGHEKAIWKSRPGYLYTSSVVVSGKCTSVAIK